MTEIDLDNDRMPAAYVYGAGPTDDVIWVRLGERRRIDYDRIRNAIESEQTTTTLWNAGRITLQDLMESKAGFIHWSEATPIPTPSTIQVNSNESST